MTVANVATWAGRSMILNQLANNALLSGVPKQIMWGYPYTGGNSIGYIINGSAITDVNLFQPGTESRVAGTVGLASANQLADTYVVTGTITATGTRTVNEVGIFDSTSASGTATTNTTASNATQTSVGLTAAGTLPAAAGGNYYCQWDNEIVLVTAGGGTTTLTVTRGALGSTATVHQASGPITAGGDGGAHSANASIGGQTANLAGANGGSILCHADFANIGLNLNDSIAFTLKVQLQ